MNYLVIDGKSYDVVVTAIEESFSILYTENTGRNTNGKMTLDPIGTYFTHKVTVKRSKDNYREFDELYNFISTPRYNGFMLEAAHNQKTIKYEAYVSQGARSLKNIDVRNKITKWGELSINFIPMEAQVMPE